MTWRQLARCWLALGRFLVAHRRHGAQLVQQDLSSGVWCHRCGTALVASAPERGAGTG